jgi:hypothetical protein
MNASGRFSHFLMESSRLSLLGMCGIVADLKQHRATLAKKLSKAKVFGIKWSFSMMLFLRADARAKTRDR